jgi:hypothetical protein
MASAVTFVDAWIPELIEPGSVLLLNSTTDDPAGASSFCALLNCPNCGRMEVLTEEQFIGRVPIICGGVDCPAQFYLRDGKTMYASVGQS